MSTAPQRLEVTKRAGLTGVRLHDVRRTYFGAGGALGLPIIGRLPGHAKVATTARCARLDNDPLWRASEAIAGRIALEGRRPPRFNHYASHPRLSVVLVASRRTMAFAQASRATNMNTWCVA